MTKHDDTAPRHATSRLCFYGLNMHPMAMRTPGSSSTTTFLVCCARALSDAGEGTHSHPIALSGVQAQRRLDP